MTHRPDRPGGAGGPAHSGQIVAADTAADSGARRGGVRVSAAPRAVAQLAARSRGSVRRDSALHPAGGGGRTGAVDSHVLGGRTFHVTAPSRRRAHSSFHPAEGDERESVDLAGWYLLKAGEQEGVVEPDAVVDALIDTIERGDLDGMAALYGPDAVQHHPLADGPVRGRDAIRESEAALFAMFSDVTIGRRTVARDEGVTFIVELVLGATNTGSLDVGGPDLLPATGRRVELPATWVIEIGSDGLIAEERDYFDTATLFRQLDLAV